MSRTPAGDYECDCCGVAGLSGGIDTAVVVSDYDRDTPGNIRTLHFCRDRTEGEGEDATEIRGCEHKLLNPAAIRHYTERKEAADRG